jgi:hypothetical protein
MRVLTMRVFLIGLTSLILGGCATLSEEQCGRGDWFGIGEADALAGNTPDRLSQHHAACAKYGVAPDAAAYDAGYGQGLEAFCVPAQGFALGRRGGSYYRQCPPETDVAFLPAHHLGHEVHALEQDLIRIESEIDDLRDEIKDEKTDAAARATAEQQLRYVKDERDRRRAARDQLLARAREYGYGNVW